MQALFSRVLAGLTLIAFVLPPQSRLDQIKREYQEARFRLQPHVALDGFLDDAPESPALLATVDARRRVGGRLARRARRRRGERRCTRL
jgi:hypothetical protein